PMAQLIASEGARDQRWRAPSPPKDAMTFATAALAVALAVIAATLWVASSVRQVMAAAKVGSGLTDTLLAICTLAAFPLLLRGHRALAAPPPLPHCPARRRHHRGPGRGCLGAQLGLVHLRLRRDRRAGAGDRHVHHRQRRRGRPHVLLPAADPRFLRAGAQC